MELRPYSNTDISLSVVGLGTWAIGSGGWKYAWGPQDDQESIKAIHAALEAGVNWIDTAAIYGLGHSEEIICKALKTCSHKPMLATKCGLHQDKKGDVYGDISEKTIRKEIEASLKRLSVEVIDIYQIHWPNPSKDIEEAFSTLLKLKEEGKIRHAAVSNFSYEQLKVISKYELPASLQSPYNLLRQELSFEVIPWCIENKVSVLAYSPLQCGLLTGKFTKESIDKLPDGDWRKSHKHFSDPFLTQALARIEKLKTIAPPMAAALNWVLAQEGITSAIVGLRNVNQVEDLIKALEWGHKNPLIKDVAVCFS